ncbi:ABC-2 type transport system ATP-binding protein [Tamaricihabitans halophyticus]|uniref:ABC-2 type transport system ATP-binding protein n=1 Tax=Tamaricihabitans halophyticus TaxID=1262583 RepID=A0A4R2Q9H8_9PSEU|nr:ABC transporter ATP-binding protein [Tamaricihabitans halophyticus]TCP44794.1 ABC-2 type transport system ATP-binding protein [Tamaricihabitans halophyticus]
MAVIEIDGLHKRYGDTIAVRDVSFAVDEGEIFGILGRNGAGKTTTVECLAGLRRPDAGMVRALGLDPQQDRSALRQVLGIQLQASKIAERLRVREALDLFASFYDKPADIDELLRLLDLEEKQHTQFRRLSGGQQQRLSIALALIGNPRVAVLDELTTGLDPRARRDTWEMIERVRASGVTIVLVTHFMAEAQRLCDRIAVIDAGSVVAIDSPAGLVARVDTGQHLSFRPSTRFDLAMLTELPEVHDAREDDGQILVTGGTELVQAVTAVLARNHIVAHELRVDQADLDDAFVELTGHRFDS